MPNKCLKISVSGGNQRDIQKSIKNAERDLSSRGYNQDIKTKRKGNTFIVSGCKS